MESLTDKVTDKVTEGKIKDGQNGHLAENGYHGQNGRSVDPMPRSEAGKAVSEEVYWRDYYEHPDFSYEWNNGILEEKPMADVRNAAIYRWLLKLLEVYLETNPIAQLVNLEIGFRLPLPHKTTIRKPDLFAVRHDNPVPLHDLDRNYTGIVDLAIESLSDSTMQEVERDTVHKKSEYEGVGVQEYYILDAEDRHTAFYYRTATGSYAPITPLNGDVIRSTVLPGFQFRISDLHRKPTLIEMAEDDVYNAFVLPEYQNQKARAERLAAKLRELGITEDELE
ncbi:MAG: Uma2 family endonuclease [Caldilineaceae bacterium]|nr:Uma2 family endonuclease [Caldilineaceae bacterium]